MFLQAIRRLSPGLSRPALACSFAFLSLAILAACGGQFTGTSPAGDEAGPAITTFFVFTV